MLFDIYLFADYSGARSASSQRKNIRLAEASREGSPRIVARRFSRDELGEELLQRLRAATAQGKRIILGQDHQYGLPAALLAELGLQSFTWMDMLRTLVGGTYGDGAPALAGPHEFAGGLNRWLLSRGLREYFYSATKSSLYGIPNRNPRAGDSGLYRLTERCRPASLRGNPKPFNRIGDSGTVGGQTLLGLLQIERLLHRCDAEGIKISVWPFDGVSIGAASYAGRHVMIEPYPTAVRDDGVAQSDDADALASASAVRRADLSGHLVDLLDLSSLSASDVELARLEGWIASHRPELVSRAKGDSASHSNRGARRV